MNDPSRFSVYHCNGERPTFIREVDSWNEAWALVEAHAFCRIIDTWRGDGYGLTQVAFCVMDDGETYAID